MATKEVKDEVVEEVKEEKATTKPAKKSAPKAKAEEVKTDEVKAEVVDEPKVEEPKIEAKVEEPKVEVKEEKKAEVKKAAPATKPSKSTETSKVFTNVAIYGAPSPNAQYTLFSGALSIDGVAENGFTKVRYKAPGQGQAIVGYTK